jgi:hypothetical protein
MFFRQQLGVRVPFASLEHDWLLCGLFRFGLYFDRWLFRTVRKLLHLS